ncbi:very short patch repair endonuclease [Brucella oryzae]|uniref:Very short patch repair endonuclease n=1 Tax=Brucella oryzae TaxID=335286 RepID=A0A2S7IWL3_9HYPH|nr:very short patch repair endonuclease [Brucella oryzae]
MDDLPVDGKRSALMGRIRSKDTNPEMIVRKALHGLGYRFRLQAKELPGRPDIVFRPRKKVIFVHGCFWHRHADCSRSTTPKTRTDFWEAKFLANQARDRRAQKEIEAMGWKYLVVWECETKSLEVLLRKLTGFIDED